MVFEDGLNEVVEGVDGTYFFEADGDGPELGRKGTSTRILLCFGVDSCLLN